MNRESLAESYQMEFCTLSRWSHVVPLVACKVDQLLSTPLQSRLRFLHPLALARPTSERPFDRVTPTRLRTESRGYGPAYRVPHDRRGVCPLGLICVPTVRVICVGDRSLSHNWTTYRLVQAYQFLWLALFTTR